MIQHGMANRSNHPTPSKIYEKAERRLSNNWVRWLQLQMRNTVINEDLGEDGWKQGIGASRFMSKFNEFKVKLSLIKGKPKQPIPEDEVEGLSEIPQQVKESVAVFKVDRTSNYVNEWRRFFQKPKRAEIRGGGGRYRLKKFSNTTRNQQNSFIQDVQDEESFVSSDDDTTDSSDASTSDTTESSADTTTDSLIGDDVSLLPMAATLFPDEEYIIGSDEFITLFQTTTPRKFRRRPETDREKLIRKYNGRQEKRRQVIPLSIKNYRFEHPSWSWAATPHRKTFVVPAGKDGFCMKPSYPYDRAKAWSKLLNWFYQFRESRD